jgi:hypothetical protein
MRPSSTASLVFILKPDIEFFQEFNGLLAAGQLGTERFEKGLHEIIDRRLERIIDPEPCTPVSYQAGFEQGPQVPGCLGLGNFEYRHEVANT